MKRASALVFMIVALTTMVWANGSKEDTSKPVVFVWLPNDSVPESANFRAAVDKIISDAIGRPVVDKLTTDYNIAVEAMATDNGALAFFGPYQYVLAYNKNKAIVPLVTNSGDSGTLADAVYYSRIIVKDTNASQYMNGGKFSIDNIQGKKFSFVSNSSTSGFLFPSSGIVSYFSKQPKWGKLTQNDLIEGGSDKFFSQVVFGGSHQGSVINVLTGKADAGAADDIDLATYVNLVSGKESEPGSVYEVKAGAAEPFDTLAGQRFEVLWAVPVLNGPITGNGNLLSKAELQKIVAAFTADSTMTNPNLFIQPGSSNKAAFTQTGKVRFLAVNNDTYAPVRAKIGSN